MNISVYGAGYVGLVSAACLAQLGHRVLCADINEARINQLKQGVCPIHERDLPELLHEQTAQERLNFTADLREAIQSSALHIIATGTPSLASGEADLSQVFSVASLIAQEVQKEGVVIIKSTVPVGTCAAMQIHLDNLLLEHRKSFRLQVASNPEFLREGSAVYDFLNADRIVVGGNEKTHAVLQEVYQPLIAQGIPLLCMSLSSAELTKYASNAMLACRISFMNQMSQLAEDTGANIEEVRKGMALDERIGPHFLAAGIGYGGSCFPKDVRALIQTALTHDLDACLLEAIDKVNESQKNWLIRQIRQHFNQELAGLTLGIWGLSFKPETDDVREASSLVIMRQLLAAKVKLRVFDPIAIPAVKALFSEQEGIHWCDSAASVFEEPLDALIIATEWDLFKEYPLAQLQHHLGKAPLFDGRNCFELTKVAAAQLSFYYSVGRPTIRSNEPFC